MFWASTAKSRGKVFLHMKPGLKCKLIDYLANKTGFSNDDIYRRVEQYVTLSDETCRILRDSIVVETKNQHRPKGVFKPSGIEYIEFIDSVIKSMISNKIHNCLANGYVDPVKSRAYANDVFNPYVSFLANTWKSQSMKCIHDIVGIEVFLDLIFNSRLYFKLNKSSYVQICGPESSYPYKDYGLSLFSPDLHLIPDDPEQLTREVFDISPKKRRFPSKYVGASKMLSQVHHAHNKLAYNQLYRRLDIGTGANEDYLAVEKTDVGKVIKFALLVVEKVFSRVWGCQKNRSLIRKFVINYVSYGEKSVPRSFMGLQGFSITSVAWAGGRKTGNIDDLKSRQLIINSFLNWFFHIYLRRLLSRFWKRIPTLAKGGRFTMDHYPIKAWHITSKKWMKAYVDDFLYELNEEFTKLDTWESNFVGSFRLLPKTNGFRLLSVPLRARPLAVDKHTKLEEIRYALYINNFIKPLQFLLSTKDRTWALGRHHHPRSYSVQLVANHIMGFKSKLLKSKKLDRIYILKFDMSRCYDNMDQSVLLNCVQRLLENDDDDCLYFVRKYAERDIESKEKEKYMFSVNDTENLDSYDLIGGEHFSLMASKSQNKAIVDRAFTTKFLKRQVLEVIENYIKDSSIFIGSQSLQLYKRKRGVFQGFPLLATLCNIFYNQLVDSVLNFLLEDMPDDSILIRLADDFLFMSTSEQQRQKVYSTICSKQFSDVGAYVNEEKTLWIDGGLSSNADDAKFTFVGLDINANLLEVSPGTILDPTRVALEKCTNFRGLYDLLTWWLKAQLKYYVISLAYGSFESQYKNLQNIWEALLKSLITNTQVLITNGNILSIHNHCEFILSVLETSLSKWKSINKSDKWNAHISNGFEKLIIQQSKHDDALSDAINVLKYI